MHEAHPVKAGEWVLVTAAAGSTGRWVVQIAKDLGATVIATYSTAKLDLVRQLGADHIIDYNKQDYVKLVLDLTSGNRVAAVFDSLGKSTFNTSLQYVAQKGSIVSFGNTTGTVKPVDII
jgi:NADPH2:quinone reductase